MHIFKSIVDLQAFVHDLKGEGKSLGFVPTMGALHQGHMSLVELSMANNDITIASIFVNPTQFNNPNDLKNYPRTFDADIKLLDNIGCTAVFAPLAKEMYPEKDTRVFNFGALEKVMEGEHRPGHFNGVGQIVSKLFDAVMPHKAYFGQKDFQQLAIIRKMTKDLKYPIEIIAVPTVREPDGLAMSSRNTLLSANERSEVALISEVLFKSKNKCASKTVEELKTWVTSTLNKNKFLTVEYFELVDHYTLQPIDKWDKTQKTTACIAVQVGNVRLIDNVNYF